jgi:hypothetical protein
MPREHASTTALPAELGEQIAIIGLREHVEKALRNYPHRDLVQDCCHGMGEGIFK